MSGRPGLGDQDGWPPSVRTRLRSWAASNRLLVGPPSALPLTKRLTVSTPAAMNTSPSPARMAGGAPPEGGGRQPDGLQRRCAVAVDRGTGAVGHPGEQGHDPGNVVARLARRLGAA